MSTFNQAYGGPLNVCMSCQIGEHDRCVKLSVDETCQCPRCWGEAQDRIDHYLADIEAKQKSKESHVEQSCSPEIIGSDEAPKPAKKMVARKRFVHPRLKVPIERKGP
jgi:hypothetical protein